MIPLYLIQYVALCNSFLLISSQTTLNALSYKKSPYKNTRTLRAVLRGTANPMTSPAGWEPYTSLKPFFSKCAMLWRAP